MLRALYQPGEARRELFEVSQGGRVAVDVRRVLRRDARGAGVRALAVPALHVGAFLPHIPRTRCAESGATEGGLGGAYTR